MPMKISRLMLPLPWKEKAVPQSNWMETKFRKEKLPILRYPSRQKTDVANSHIC
jgi:hypothetical protein